MALLLADTLGDIDRLARRHKVILPILRSLYAEEIFDIFYTFTVDNSVYDKLFAVQ